MQLKDTLFKIYTQPTTDIEIVIQIPNHLSKRIRKDQKVMLNFSQLDFSEDETLKGFIKSIGPAHDSNYHGVAKVKLENVQSINPQNQIRLLREYKINGEATILVNDKSLLSTLLGIKSRLSG